MQRKRLHQQIGEGSTMYHESSNRGAGDLKGFLQNKILSAKWTYRLFAVVFINFVVCVWYARIFMGTSRDVRRRVISLWLPTSSIYLFVEYMSKDDEQYNAAYLIQITMLNAFHYIIGYLVFYFNTTISVGLCGIGMCTYTLSVVHRYHFSQKKLHRYSLIFEVMVSTLFLPIFLVTDLVTKNPPSQQFFVPYLITDVLLKVVRTTLLFYFRDEFLVHPSYQRQGSWGTSVSETSLMDFISSLVK